MLGHQSQHVGIALAKGKLQPWVGARLIFVTFP